MNTDDPISKPRLSVFGLLGRGIHFVYEKCIVPKSVEEDDRRHEFILNTILATIIPLLVIFDVFIDIAVRQEGRAYRGVPFLLFTAIVLLFIWLLFISRKGYYRLATYLMLLTYFSATTVGALHWGIELPMTTISYIVIIIISSILVSTFFGFLVTAFTSLTVLSVTMLQLHHIVSPHLYWKYTPIRINDPIELSIVFFVVTTVAWLSNREIEASLKRARASEKALKDERDQLEITVEERTREVKEMQKEKISQLYRFAEFGRLSSGVFHDLMNSLHSVALNVEQLEQSPDKVPNVQEHLEKAVMASKRMGGYIQKVRKQIAAENMATTFSVEEEVSNALDMLRFKAQEASVTLKTTIHHSPVLYGNPIKLYQVILNLVGNAIEACEENKNFGIVEVVADLDKSKKNIFIKVKDNGSGIPPHLHTAIFTPFFSTKQYQKGIGLGLSQTKEIVENDFKGTIAVTSKKHHTVFTITIPLIIPDINEQ
ncbi:MAG TPA: HAMP domain-containing sensor histidine kinase [Candidatus Paceibacterota bacterium]|jgi:signal transduction histidine kinase|nr:HAMP domain-containing sensor histidine kinase [Candidatus Paceibacterota bacterium]